MQRVFLNWGRPLLPSAAQWLLESHPGGDECDLSEVICVVPGKRAGRLLQYFLLTQHAAAGEGAVRPLLPPRIITPGALHQVVMHGAGAVAQPIECRLAWRAAIEDAPAGALEALRVQATSASSRAGLAILAANLSDHLSAAELTFDDVAAHVAKRGGHEALRWKALANIESIYLIALDRAGLLDPGRAWRRASQTGDVATGAALVLIGVPDLNRSQRRLIAACGSRVAALVHAPDELAGEFDEFGCVKPAAWALRTIDLRDERIHIVDRSFDQAQEALRLLARGAEDGWAADDVTIGLGDESLQTAVLRATEWAGVRVHSAAGSPLSGTSPFVFLERAANWLEEPRFVHMTALLRHPDLEHLIRRSFASDEDARKGVSKWLGLVEAYFAEHLHHRFTGAWLGSEDDQSRMKMIWEGICSVSSGLRTEGSRPLSEWCSEIRNLLAATFGDMPVTASSDRGRTIEACREFASILESLAAAPAALQPALPSHEAIRLVLEEARSRSVPDEAHPFQIDLLGFLELHHDPVPHLILAGFNDGAIPRSVKGDAFLPDSFRAELGLACSESLVARDAYLLSAILASRQSVDVIVGKRGELDEQITPSRFLFQTDEESMRRRINDLVADRSHHQQPSPIGLPAPAPHSQFYVPDLPDEIEPPAFMRVTEFRTYLSCPYRWALERGLGLKSIDLSLDEMDPLRFGNLAHEALEAFGRDSGARDSTDPAEIAAFLDAALDRSAASTFGDVPPPAVAVQLAHLKQRLRDFAKRQAQWRAEGWEIRHCELSFKDEVELDLPGEDVGMPLRGTIDRIDYNPAYDLWRIVDYKTGERGNSPHAAHHGTERVPPDARNRWIDLQLPLYFYLLRRSGRFAAGRGELGCIVLPKSSGGTRFVRGEWSRDLLEEAIDVARGVVCDIRSRRFALNLARTGYDSFPRICQSNVFGGPRLRSDPTHSVSG